MTQPRYFPFLHGVYDVKAGITALGRDQGNGDADGRVFQLDGRFEMYRDAKRAAQEHPDRHLLRDGLLPGAEYTIARWVVDRLVAEYPSKFAMRRGALHCTLTGDVIDCGRGALSLDALAMQVQSDWAVLQLEGDEASPGNRISYLHVSMPSGWRPEEKIGRPFDAVHQPVPHIEPINAKQHAIAKLMVHATRGAVRFAWTVTQDPALNHHPLARKASAGDPLLRVERQVIWGFPEHRASLFTIRTYLYTRDDLDERARQALASAVGGMSDASLRYKSMDRAAILAWLAG
ncbi:MAG: heme-dependent oxidative N-demethylase subunit alpha family protein [Phycisphaerales bacterium JB063]